MRNIICRVPSFIVLAIFLTGLWGLNLGASAQTQSDVGKPAAAGSAQETVSDTSGTTEVGNEALRAADQFFDAAQHDTTRQEAAQQGPIDASDINLKNNIKRMEFLEKVARQGMLHLTGTAVIAFSLIAIFTFRNIISGTHFIQAIGLVFLVYGTVILTIIADTDQQLTAAIGVLGAIAGYLFGSRTAALETASARQDQRTP